MDSEVFFSNGDQSIKEVEGYAFLLEMVMIRMQGFRISTKNPVVVFSF